MNPSEARTLTIPIFAGFSLRISPALAEANPFPTRRLQKGLVLLHHGQELAEEGVGFGAPILKAGNQTFFPAGISLVDRPGDSVWEVRALFRMNLVERLTRPRPGTEYPRSLYTVKDSLADLHRRWPPLRGPLTSLSSALRKVFRWETTYEEADLDATVGITYSIDRGEGRVGIAADTSSLPRGTISEVVMMSEQGARPFDRYRETGGPLLHGRQIGSWDEVASDAASFISVSHGLAFTLRQAEGARLFRGRELVGSRLAWSGFGYSFPPTTKNFSYEVRLERVP